MRKVFLDDLPKFNVKLNKINWGKSIGYTVNFIYDDIQGEIKIIDYDTNNQKLTIQYLNNIQMINTTQFRKAGLSIMTDKKSHNFRFDIGTIIQDNKRNLTIIKQYRKKRNKKQYSCLEKWYICHCNLCGCDNQISQSDLNKGIGCGYCCANPSKIKIGYNDI